MARIYESNGVWVCESDTVAGTNVTVKATREQVNAHLAAKAKAAKEAKAKAAKESRKPKK